MKGKLIIKNKKDLENVVKNVVSIYEFACDIYLDMLLDEDAEFLSRDWSKIERGD